MERFSKFDGHKKWNGLLISIGYYLWRFSLYYPRLTQLYGTPVFDSLAGVGIAGLLGVMGLRLIQVIIARVVEIRGYQTYHVSHIAPPVRW